MQSQTCIIYNLFLSKTVKHYSNVVYIIKGNNSDTIWYICMLVLKYVITVLFNMLKPLPTCYNYCVSYTAITTKVDTEATKN